jgi:hypothetical protein
MGRLIVVLLVLFAVESSAATAQDLEPSQHSRQLVQKVAPVYPNLPKKLVAAFQARSSF